MPLTASKCHKNAAQYLSKQKKKWLSCTQQCQNRPYVTDIAQKFKVSRSAVSKIIKNQDAILSKAEVTNHQKWNRGSKHSEIDKALYLWFSEICQKDIPVSGYSYI